MKDQMGYSHVITHLSPYGHGVLYIPTQQANGILLVSFLLLTIAASSIQRLDTLLLELIFLVS